MIKACKYDLVVYSAHTNLDNAAGGVNFRFARTLVTPSRDGGWMSQFVYASHLVRTPAGTLRLYFNARDKAAALAGTEHIGFAEAVLR